MECLRFSLQEFLTPEVFVLQEQMSALQVKLDEEEHKNLKLQQHIDRLEHHSTQMQEVRPGAWPQKCVKQIGKGRVYRKKMTSQSLSWADLRCVLHFVTPHIAPKMRHTSLV